MNIEVAEQTLARVRVNVQVTSEEFEDALGKGLPPFLAAMGLRVSPETDYNEALKTLANDDTDDELNRIKMDCAVSYMMPRAVEQSGFFPACNPAIVESNHNEDGTVSFVVEIHPKPEVELNDYGPITVQAAHPVVTEEEIDRRIDAMAARGAVTQPDIITGKPKKVPAMINDKWVARNVPGCENVADLRRTLRAAGEKFKEQEFEKTKQELALAELAKRLVAPIPEETIEAVTDSMMGELANQLAQQGVTLQDYVIQRKVTMDAMREDARRQAEGNLRQGAILDAFFRHLNLTLEDSDIDAALAVIAPGIENQAKESFERNGFMFTVTETAQRMRAAAAILDLVTVEWTD